MTTARPPLSPTARTTIGRSRERAREDRTELHALLAGAVVAHLGVIVDDHPVVLPVALAVDPDGPDSAGSLYVHGSVAAGWLQRAAGAAVCVTVTEVDALVLARSGFHHSMNYRSAVVIGTARRVSDPVEVTRVLDLVVDHLVPGRAATLRPHTRRELAATALLAVPLLEASLKQRTGDPHDDDDDVAAGTWAGLLPLTRTIGSPVTAGDSHAEVPPDVRRRAGRRPTTSRS
ncbi:pyridoxamine 5'-phosphate oxidase family protein [Rhodococcus antarcticus]|jgi:nitroimidazol reductase NimA-like FMN-containing flavoprotein (pyridoxamine 5'-phosphate oxidase superfamily)|uniref:Pyridoxamine 5'-phosphate oxidase family protein n=1 Tax=Rhodococcus antarcticus TaxID=2987751 RepID=A0ABY6P2B4_9NOCA|nr:pyridoxamine 5'-phosphate oxidase family protein [Rhodococcus antarcticus]UZJ25283.1 pyridoxamine 5'-phosphate oxidase family protein [Rhodococcus antarcticus]